MLLPRNCGQDRNRRTDTSGQAIKLRKAGQETPTLVSFFAKNHISTWRSFWGAHQNHFSKPGNAFPHFRPPCPWVQVSENLTRARAVNFSNRRRSQLVGRPVLRLRAAGRGVVRKPVASRDAVSRS